MVLDKVSKPKSFPNKFDKNINKPTLVKIHIKYKSIYEITLKGVCYS